MPSLNRRNQTGLRSMKRIRKRHPISIFILMVLLLLECKGSTNSLDYILFGASEKYSQSGNGVTVSSPDYSYAVPENPTNGTLDIEIRLNKIPTADVTLPLSLSHTDRAIISVPTVTFTASNWDSPQTITITGIDNLAVEGNKDISLYVGKATSEDKSYNGLYTPSIGITVIDDDSYNIVVSPKKNLITTEKGNTASFTVVLSKAPSSNVVIPTVQSSDLTEGTVSPASLTFTSGNFNTPQVVTITGVDDVLTDGNIQYKINFGNSTSSDTNYNNLILSSVSVTNIDYEEPAIIVTPTTLNINEAGAAKTFTVTLTVEPPGNVTIPVSSSNPSRATVDTSLLTFTPANYNNPQIVTVTPVNNEIADGNVIVNIVLGIATDYGNENPPDVKINITDDDTPGIAVSTLNTNTNEAGQNAFFTVVLTSEPTSNVTVSFNEKKDSVNLSNQEGTIDQTQVVFTPSNWNSPQSVVVTGVDDDVMDGNVQYQIRVNKATSSDSKYNNRTPSPNFVTVNNLDDDTAGFVIVANGNTTLTSNSSVSINGFATDDSAKLDPQTYSKFTIRLRSQPLSNVTLNLSSGSTTNDGILNTSSLVFTPSKGVAGGWDQDREVTVTGNTNGANEGNHDYTVSTSNTTTDDKYGSTTFVKNPSFVYYSCDNDVDNLISSCRRSGGFSTSEGGGTATVYLITQSSPSSAVTVPASSDDTTEGNVTASATITSGNWNTMISSGTNKIIASGVDDALVDGNVLYNIIYGTATGGLTYTSPSTPIRNIDDEQVLTFSNISGDTSEDGTSATFKVKLGLSSPPTGDVTFTLSCKSGSTECASVSPTSLTFTSSDYNINKTITITGKNDNRVDGTQSSCVSFSLLTSSDATFDQYQPPDYCGVQNLDNDKLIWITSLTKSGNLNSGMTVADDSCNDGADPNKPTDMGSATYKALIVDGSTRVATTTGTNASGQTNWVLDASTDYYLKNGGLPYSNKVFTTNSFKLFSFGSLTTAFSGSGSDSFWTGLNSNWTTASNHCNMWTDDITSGITGQYGIGNVLGSGSVSSGNDSCSVSKKFICVQQ
ncbi:hypothetical protein CH365_17665 [Leptospira neocaledonica]|uniref:DUF1554 domain-containing protein n=2 Tax=Leptospira neocaledonica TaxID=2023192 RepID=A0A2M9ZU13_9LEPT|nr:hypothetical protein CH365_17665 [Leptospira neocaledonica]